LLGRVRDDVPEVVDVLVAAGRTLIDRNNRLMRHGWTFQRAGSSGAQVHLWSFNAGQPGKPRRQRTDRDGAARLLVYDVHVHVGVDLRVPVEAFALDSQMGRLLSGLQLAETMPT